MITVKKLYLVVVVVFFFSFNFKMEETLAFDCVTNRVSSSGKIVGTVLVQGKL